jgi:hypothetical protein
LLLATTDHKNKNTLRTLLAKNTMASLPPASKKQKTTDVSSPDTAIDLEVLKKMWSPGRERRHQLGTIKIESPAALSSIGAVKDTMIPARAGALRGGDWILNKDGGAATISFFFLHDGETYGLTVGHLVEKVGDPVFCFSQATKLPNPFPQNSEVSEGHETDESYFMHEIGSAVSLSRSTDSLVFDLNGMVSVSEPLKMAPGSGIMGKLKLPDVRQVMPPRPPLIGTSLVGFGAQRRGAHAKVRIPTATVDFDHSRKGNIGIIDADDVGKKVTDAGDCGSIFASLDGTAQHFHHCGDGDDNEPPPLSYGYPVWEVLKSHKHLGGEGEDILEEEEDDKKTQAKECGVVASPGGVAGPKKTLKHFPGAKIVVALARHAVRSLANFMSPNLKVVSGKNDTPVTLCLNTKAAKKN